MYGKHLPHEEMINNGMSLIVQDGRKCNNQTIHKKVLCKCDFCDGNEYLLHGYSTWLCSIAFICCPTGVITFDKAKPLKFKK